MFQVGLMVLTSPPKLLLGNVVTFLRAAKDKVAQRLYIKFDPSLSGISHSVSNQERAHLAKLIPYIYLHTSAGDKSLDVRVLQSIVKSGVATAPPDIPQVKFDIVFTDYLEPSSSEFQTWFRKTFQRTHLGPWEILKLDESKNSEKGNNNFVGSSHLLFDNVVLGGTFDRFHVGHKLLLSEAILHTTLKLTIGITDGPMLRKKILKELIEPLDTRISMVHNFVTEVDPTIQYHIVPIYDPFGPAVEDADMNCIIVSEETKKGGLMVNEERKKRGLKELFIHCIPLVKEDAPSLDTVELEDKVSSSTLRMQALGTLLKPPKVNLALPPLPYIIGLTGNIASGKSHIREYLAQLGAEVIDCDKLAHESYHPGTPIYQQVVAEFGSDILAEDGTVNRARLGALVFSNELHRKKLNSIVWPGIKEMVDEKIKKFRENRVPIVVLEAAVLLEAGWDALVHQVWVTIITEEEAIIRLQKRNKISQEDAIKRIKSQKPAKDLVERANVVFSTLWDPSFTRSQVDKAWEMLKTFVNKECN